MTIEVINEPNDIAEAVASFMMDDGDIAVERFVNSQAATNPFFVGEQPMDTAASNWMAAVTFDASAFHDQTFEVIEHDTDAMHFAVEDIQATDLDLSGLQV
jgi:uncharacterized hydantoinase/oxoprolinase family protein